MKAPFRRLGVAVTGLTCVLAGLAGIAPEASASISCSTGNHCYSYLNGYGTTFYGLYGTWNRAAMNVPTANSSNKYFVDSEIWGVQGSAWVEAGLAQGYFQPETSVGYFGFAAYMDTSGYYKEYSFGAKTQNASVTDEFQISRGGSANVWNAYCDGVLRSTPAIGFWVVSTVDVGGEVFGALATSGQSTMYVKGYNSALARVNLGLQQGIVNQGMVGSSPASSTWKWNII
ncbi:MAG: hypothetical protein FWC46_08200 [Actinomycetia bacterium]|nr:hypothetical protein [Actinomycetes bacterium]